MSNLKSAPLPLTPAVAAKLAGDRPALGKGIVHLPIAGKLVDRPRCGCPQIVVDRVNRGGTCGRGGCPYGGDF